MNFVAPCLKQHLHLSVSSIPETSQAILDSSSKYTTVVFHYGRERGVVLENLSEAQVLLLSLLDGKHSFPDIVTQVQQSDPSFTAQDVSDVLEQLAEFSLIEDAATSPPEILSDTDLIRYASQIRFFSVVDTSGKQKYEMQNRVKQARVAVLGLGGLGSNILIGLAALGVGFIRGIDLDRVETGNLNRQVLYDTTDIGKPKAIAAAEHLKLFNPEILFEPVQRRIDGMESIIELIQDVDIVAMCADTPDSIHSWMNSAALNTGVPFIIGGYHGASTEVGPFVIPYQTSCLACNGANAAPRAIPEPLAWVNETSRLRHPNVHFVVAIAANLICGEICKYLTRYDTPYTYNAICGLNTENFSQSVLPYPRNPACRQCGEGQNIHIEENRVSHHEYEQV